MAVSELGSIAEIEGWTQPAQRGLPLRVRDTLWRFTRKKPLGAACGLIVILAFIVGDFVPETINKIANTPVSLPYVGTIKPDFGTPIPYLADQLEKHTSIVYPYQKQDLRARLQGSSSSHLLGTDAIGRDIFSRLLYGARVAVMVSLGATLLHVFIGASIAIISGYYGGTVDKVLFRFVDVVQSLPGLVMLIAFLGLFSSSVHTNSGHLWLLILAIGLIGWPLGSRVIRSQTIYIMSSPYIEAARVIGASDIRIMVHYILPNVFALIILGATLTLGAIVLLEATLSFLGYGLPPPFPSWGQMLSLEGREYMRTQPGLAIYPGIAIGILVFSFNLFGDALRDVLDPRLRGSR